MRTISVYIQINSSGESTKHGVSSISECEELLQHIQSTCSRVRVAGIMTIGSCSGEKLSEFNYMKNTYDQLKKKYGPGGFELSMGMSDDFEEAIKCGATTVRIGSALFGKRPAKTRK